MSETTIAITGATGGIGGRVARRLVDVGTPLRLVVRDAAQAPDLPNAEVAVAASYADAEGMRRALEGVPNLFLVSAREAEDRVAEHLSAVDAAVAAGIERIVYLSIVGAAADATFTFAHDHWATEQRIRSAGRRFTFLRSSLYLDYMPYLPGEDGVIRGPAGDGRLAPVARDDIADVAAAVLTGDGADVHDGHDGSTYDMTGEGRFTMAEIAERLTRIAGRPIGYVDETLEEAHASRAHYGAPDWAVEGWITSYAAVANGEMDVVSDTVRRLAGHPPLTLEGFVERYPQSIEHLVAR